eukprot:3458992-Amphidinium_carterae.1
MAVAQDGAALEFAAEPLKSDREIVLTAVANDGRALKFAAEPLKSDREIVLTAVAYSNFPLHNADVLVHAADALLEDESFAVEARERLYFFKVIALSGRSCIIPWPCNRLLRPQSLISVICRKLGLQSTGREMLLFGDAVVPEDVDEDSPGCPRPGKLVQYQLVL